MSNISKSIIPEKSQERYYELAKIKNRWGTGLLKLTPDFITEKFNNGEVGKMLEVGCGLAEILKYIPEDIEYCGIDPVEYAIEKCKKEYPQRNFLIGRAEKLPFGDNVFDLVLSIRALEMLEDPRAGLSEMARVVRPGGFVILEAPNFELPWSRVRSFRHYGKIDKVALRIKRFWVLFLRNFGILSFRTIPQNFSEATGKWETGDDDAKYLTSAYEVAQFYKKANFKIIYYYRRQFPNNSFKNLIKNLVLKIPSLKYAGNNIFFIFQKYDK